MEDRVVIIFILNNETKYKLNRWLPKFKTFYPIYISKEIIIPYGIHPFDICSKNPELWLYIKIIYICIFVFSNF